MPGKGAQRAVEAEDEIVEHGGTVSDCSSRGRRWRRGAGQKNGRPEAPA